MCLQSALKTGKASSRLNGRTCWRDRVAGRMTHRSVGHASEEESPGLPQTQRCMCGENVTSVRGSTLSAWPTVKRHPHYWGEAQETGKRRS